MNGGEDDSTEDGSIFVLKGLPTNDSSLSAGTPIPATLDLDPPRPPQDPVCPIYQEGIANNFFESVEMMVEPPKFAAAAVDKAEVHDFSVLSDDVHLTINKARNSPSKNDTEFLDQIQKKIQPIQPFPSVHIQKIETFNYLKDSASSHFLKIVKPEIRSEGNPTTLNTITHSSSDQAELSPNLPKLSEKQYDCPICHVKFQGQYAICHHIESNHTEVTQPYLCFTCPSTFKTNNDLKCHLLTQHPIDFKSYNKDSSNNWTSTGQGKIIRNPNQVRCLYCPKTFQSASTLALHISKHTKEKPWVCKTCGAKFSLIYGLQAHQKAKRCHNVLKLQASRNFKCTSTDCYKAFTTNWSLKSHLNTEHGIKLEVKKPSYNCLFCDYKAKTAYTLTCHNRRHAKEAGGPCIKHVGRIFSCKGCKKPLKSKSALSLHVKWHCPAFQKSPLEKFPCSKCGKILGTIPALKLHQKRYCAATKPPNLATKDKPGRKFDPNKTVADGVPRVTCKACFKTLKSKCGLKNHLHYHCSAAEIEKPPLDPLISLHCCDHCPETFIEASRKIKHENTHGNKHPCKYCSTGFKTFFLLNRHKLRIHQKSNCCVCNLDFDSPQALVAHEIQVHILSEAHSSSQPGPVKKHPDIPAYLILKPSIPNKSPIIDKVTKLYRCETCPTTFTSIHNLRYHKLQQNCESKRDKFIKADRMKLFKCPECNKTFIGKDTLTNHQNAVHRLYGITIDIEDRTLEEVTVPPIPDPDGKSSYPFQVEFSELEINSKDLNKVRTTVVKTKLKLTEETKYSVPRIYTSEVTVLSCPDCKKTLTSKYALSQHKKLNCPVQNTGLHCKHCPETFSHAKGKVRHEKCHGDKHLCPYCPTGFKLLTRLTRHQHLFHKKPACFKCKLDFATPEALLAHNSQPQVHIISEIRSSRKPGPRNSHPGIGSYLVPIPSIQVKSSQSVGVLLSESLAKKECMHRNFPEESIEYIDLEPEVENLEPSQNDSSEIDIEYKIFVPMSPDRS